MQPVDFDAASSQPFALAGARNVERLVQRVTGMSASAQRAWWAQVDDGTRQAAAAMGYQPPSPNTQSWVGQAVETVAGPAAAVVRPAWEGIYRVASPVIGGALTVAQEIGDVPIELFQAVAADDSDVVRLAGLVGAVGAVAIVGAATGGLGAAPLVGAFGAGGLASAAGVAAGVSGYALAGLTGAYVAAGITDHMVGNGDLFSERRPGWGKVAERWYRGGALEDATRMLLDNGSTLTFARRVALSLDEGDEERLVSRTLDELVSVYEGGTERVMLDAVERLARRAAPPGTKAYQDAYQAGLAMLDDPTFRKAVEMLRRAKVSPGRELVHLVGGDPTEGWGKFVSGMVDASAWILTDPLIVVGKTARLSQLSKFGLYGSVLDDLSGDGLIVLHNRIDKITSQPSVQGWLRYTAETLNKPNGWSRLAMTRPQDRGLLPALRQWQVSAKIGEWTPERLVDFFKDAETVKMLAGGGSASYKSGAVLLPHVGWTRTPVGLRSQFIDWAKGVEEVRLDIPLPDTTAALWGEGKRIVGDNVVDNLVRVDELPPAYVAGRRTPRAVAKALAPVTSLPISLTTRVPRRRMLPTTWDDWKSLSREAGEEWVAFTEFGRMMGVSAPVREAWLDMLISSNPGTRRTAIKGYLHTMFDEAGITSLPEGSRLVDDYLRKIDQAFGIEGERAVLLGDQSEWIQIPDLHELRRDVQRGLFHKMLNVADSDMITHGINRYWKPAVLLRIGFVTRAVGDELLSWLFREGVGGVTAAQVAAWAERPAKPERLAGYGDLLWQREATWYDMLFRGLWRPGVRGDVARAWAGGMRTDDQLLRTAWFGSRHRWANRFAKGLGARRLEDGTWLTGRQRFDMWTPETSFGRKVKKVWSRDMDIRGNSLLHVLVDGVPDRTMRAARLYWSDPKVRAALMRELSAGTMPGIMSQARNTGRTLDLQGILGPDTEWIGPDTVELMTVNAAWTVLGDGSPEAPESLLRQIEMRYHSDGDYLIPMIEDWASLVDRQFVKLWKQAGDVLPVEEFLSTLEQVSAAASPEARNVLRAVLAWDGSWTRLGEVGHTLRTDEANRLFRGILADGVVWGPDGRTIARPADMVTQIKAGHRWAVDVYGQDSPEAALFDMLLEHHRVLSGGSDSAVQYLSKIVGTKMRPDSFEARTFKASWTAEDRKALTKARVSRTVADNPVLQERLRSMERFADTVAVQQQPGTIVFWMPTVTEGRVVALAKATDADITAAAAGDSAVAAILTEVRAGWPGDVPVASLGFDESLSPLWDVATHDRDLVRRVDLALGRLAGDPGDVANPLATVRVPDKLANMRSDPKWRVMGDDDTRFVSMDPTHWVADFRPPDSPATRVVRPDGVVEFVPGRSLDEAYEQWVDDVTEAMENMWVTRAPDMSDLLDEDDIRVFIDDITDGPVADRGSVQLNGRRIDYQWVDDLDEPVKAANVDGKTVLLLDRNADADRMTDFMLGKRATQQVDVRDPLPTEATIGSDVKVRQIGQEPVGWETQASMHWSTPSRIGVDTPTLTKVIATNSGWDEAVVPLAGESIEHAVDGLRRQLKGAYQIDLLSDIMMNPQGTTRSDRVIYSWKQVLGLDPDLDMSTTMIPLLRRPESDFVEKTRALWDKMRARYSDMPDEVFGEAFDKWIFDEFPALINESDVSKLVRIVRDGSPPSALGVGPTPDSFASPEDIQDLSDAFVEWFKLSYDYGGFRREVMASELLGWVNGHAEAVIGATPEMREVRMAAGGPRLSDDGFMDEEGFYFTPITVGDLEFHGSEIMRDEYRTFNDREQVAFQALEEIDRRIGNLETVNWQEVVADPARLHRMIDPDDEFIVMYHGGHIPGHQFQGITRREAGGRMLGAGTYLAVEDPSRVLAYVGDWGATGHLQETGFFYVFGHRRDFIDEMWNAGRIINVDRPMAPKHLDDTVDAMFEAVLEGTGGRLEDYADAIREMKERMRLRIAAQTGPQSDVKTGIEGHMGPDIGAGRYMNVLRDGRNREVLAEIADAQRQAEFLAEGSNMGSFVAGGLPADFEERVAEMLVRKGYVGGWHVGYGDGDVFIAWDVTNPDVLQPLGRIEDVTGEKTVLAPKGDLPQIGNNSVNVRVLRNVRDQRYVRWSVADQRRTKAAEAAYQYTPVPRAEFPKTVHVLARPGLVDDVEAMDQVRLAAAKGSKIVVADVFGMGDTRLLSSELDRLGIDHEVATLTTLKFGSRGRRQVKLDEVKTQLLGGETPYSSGVALDRFGDPWVTVNIDEADEAFGMLADDEIGRFFKSLPKQEGRDLYRRFVQERLRASLLYDDPERQTEYAARMLDLPVGGNRAYSTRTHPDDVWSPFGDSFMARPDRASVEEHIASLPPEGQRRLWAQYEAHRSLGKTDDEALDIALVDVGYLPIEDWEVVDPGRQTRPVWEAINRVDLDADIGMRGFAADPEAINLPHNVIPKRVLKQYEKIVGKTNAWDRIVRFGFGRVIGPMIDDLLRTPQAIQHYADRLEEIDRQQRWMYDQHFWAQTERIVVGDEVTERPGVLYALASRLNGKVAGKQWSNLLESDKRAFEDSMRAMGLLGPLEDGENLYRAVAHGRDETVKAIRQMRIRLQQEVDDLSQGALLVEDNRVLDVPGMLDSHPDIANRLDLIDRLNRSEALVGDAVSMSGAAVQMDDLADWWDELPAGLKRDALGTDKAKARRARRKINEMSPWHSPNAVKGGQGFSKADFAVMEGATANRANVRRHMHDIAISRTVKDMSRYIDRDDVRTHFSEATRNLIPFWHAEDQFLRRWARTFAYSPHSIRVAQLLYLGLKEVGTVQKDQYGNDMFVYPGSAAFTEVLSKVPGLKPLEPVATAFTGQVQYSLPGLDRFGVPQVSPFVGVPLQQVTEFMPELMPMTASLLGERGARTDLVTALMPTQFRRFMDAVVLDPMANERTWGSMMQAIAVLEANGNGLPDNATPDQVEEYLDRIRNHTRTVLLAKALFGFMAPASPQTMVLGGSQPGSAGSAWSWKALTGAGAPDALLNDEYIRMVRNLGPEEGTVEFLRRYPDTTPYDLVNRNRVYGVGRTEGLGGAPISPTDRAWAFYVDNKTWVEQNPMAAAWLMPPASALDEASDRNGSIYLDQMAVGLRSRQTPDEYVRSLKFAAASHDYFRVREQFDFAIEQTKVTGDNETRGMLEAEKSAWSAQYLALHPIFAQEIQSGDGRSRRQEVLSALRDARYDPAVPVGTQTEGVMTLVEGFDRFRARMVELSASNSLASRKERENLRAVFKDWGDSMVQRNPNLAAFWTGVILPEASV